MSNKNSQQNHENYLEEDEIKNEYNEFIKESVLNGNYFKDARDWYIFRYITPICDRALLGILIIIICSTLYTIKIIGESIFPLVVSQAIFIPPNDPTIYETKLTKIRPKKNEANFDAEVQTFDESILKYLIVNHIKNRESFDFRKGKIEDVNKKFSHVKNNSTFREYKNFQAIMSKDNKNSPIHFFGKNVIRNITINSIKFKRREGKNAIEKALFYIANSPPLEADVDFTTTTIFINDINEKDYKYERFLVKIKYDYQQIFKNTQQPNISFTINQYSLYRMK
jgi:type IV secretory pathway component VirB8